MHVNRLNVQINICAVALLSTYHALDVCRFLKVSNHIDGLFAQNDIMQMLGMLSADLLKARKNNFDNLVNILRWLGSLGAGCTSSQIMRSAWMSIARYNSVSYRC